MSAPQDSAPPRAEIGVAVVERDRRFLVGLRPKDVPLGGLWEFPGGKVRSGETPSEAAVREFLEETGWLVRVVGRYAEVAHDYPHASLRLHFFACQCVEQRGPLSPRFQWIEGSQLKRLSFPAANAGLLQMLAADTAPGSLQE